MKFLFQIALLFFLIASCNDPKTSLKDIGVKSSILKDSLAVKDSIRNNYKVTLEERQYNIDAYNNKYLMQILPDSSASRAQMKYRVLLTLKSDTIINQAINMDTILSRSHKFKTDIDKIQFKDNYYLSEIGYASVRARYMHLGANLTSKKDSTQMHINIQFEYIGSETGKLRIF